MNALRELISMLTALRHEAPAGPILLACGALYIVVGVFACARRPSAKAPVLAGLLGMSAFGTIGGALSLVIAGRRGMLKASMPSAGPVDVSFGAAASTIEMAFILLAAALLWTSLIGMVVLARAAVARRADEAPPGAAATSLVIFAGVVGGLLMVRSLGVAAAMDGFMSDVLRAVVEAGAPVHRHAGTITIMTAVMAAVVVAVLCLRAERGGAPRPRAGEKIASGALLLAGIAAFIATRPHAADAALPLPYDAAISFSSAQEDARTRTLPEVADCNGWSPAYEAPQVDIREGGVSLDGRLDRPEELTRRLRDKRALWAQIYPGRALPPLILSAERGAAPAAVEPYLRTIRQLWPEGLTLVGVRPPQAWDSRTLGEFPRRPRTCPVVLQWGDGGRSMTSMKTWQDVARRAEEAPSDRWAP